MVAPVLEHLHVFDRSDGRLIDPLGAETVACRLAAVGTAD